MEGRELWTVKRFNLTSRWRQDSRWESSGVFRGHSAMAPLMSHTLSFLQTIYRHSALTSGARPFVASTLSMHRSQFRRPIWLSKGDKCKPLLHPSPLGAYGASTLAPLSLNRCSLTKILNTPLCESVSETCWKQQKTR